MGRKGGGGGRSVGCRVESNMGRKDGGGRSSSWTSKRSAGRVVVGTVDQDGGVCPPVIECPPGTL